MRNEARAPQQRRRGALNLASTFLASFPPSAEPSLERKLASSPRVREDGVLSVEVAQEGSALVVRPRGELDLASAKTFEEVLWEAFDGDASAIVLDLSGLSFIDSTGLRSLVSVTSHSRRNGNRLRMLHGSEPVEQVLKLTGLHQALPFIDSLRAKDENPERQGPDPGPAEKPGQGETEEGQGTGPPPESIPGDEGNVPNPKQ